LENLSWANARQGPESLGILRNMAQTEGQRAAVRAAINRRAELGLTQEQLAARSGVTSRTIGSFERGVTWPRAKTMGQLERLGLNWPVGYLRELADDVDRAEEQEYRYPSRARAAKIRELEAQKARIDAELEELRGE
jgi:transcriptional regulator with XRE-family HTH domain